MDIADVLRGERAERMFISGVHYIKYKSRRNLPENAA